MQMRDDPDEQEQVRRLRERGSHASAPVTPRKACWAPSFEAAPAVYSTPAARASARGAEGGLGGVCSGSKVLGALLADGPGQPIEFNPGSFTAGFLFLALHFTTKTGLCIIRIAIGCPLTPLPILARRQTEKRITHRGCHHPTPSPDPPPSHSKDMWKTKARPIDTSRQGM